MARVKILVEDEKNIARVASYNLEKEGYQVSTAADGQEALDKIRKDPPALVVLDVMLPTLDGLEVCRRLRADPKTAALPIIMLTAKTQEADRVVGLELGADDYIPKPFSPRELAARVKAVLRRSSRGARRAVWQCGAVEADWERRVVKLKQKPLSLTPKEFELFKALIDADGRVLTREQLLERVWGYDQAVEIQSRTVDLHVSQLRQKLGPEGKRILTSTGAGYRFLMPDEAPG